VNCLNESDRNRLQYTERGKNTRTGRKDAMYGIMEWVYLSKTWTS